VSLGWSARRREPGHLSTGACWTTASLSPNDFTDTDEIIRPLADFETRYNQTATEFKWKFTTTTDLRDFLQRLDQHTDHPASA